MVEDNQTSCLCAMAVLLVLNLGILLWDRQVRHKLFYALSAFLAAMEIAAYLVLESLPPGWGTDYPHLGFLPFLWLGSFLGALLLSYFGLWNFLNTHRRTRWGTIGVALLILAHIAAIAFGFFLLLGALYSFRWG